MNDIPKIGKSRQLLLSLVRKFAVHAKLQGLNQPIRQELPETFQFFRSCFYKSGFILFHFFQHCFPVFRYRKIFFSP
jgi:hypothetical protein